MPHRHDFRHDDDFRREDLRDRLSRPGGITVEVSIARDELRFDDRWRERDGPRNHENHPNGFDPHGWRPDHGHGDEPDRRPDWPDHRDDPRRDWPDHRDDGPHYGPRRDWPD